MYTFNKKNSICLTLYFPLYCRYRQSFTEILDFEKVNPKDPETLAR